jgi:hypothetical protein
MVSASRLWRVAPESFAKDLPYRDAHIAFASHRSKDWSLLEEERGTLCGDPSHQQEGGASRHGQHYERPEMMIIRLAAQWTAFFH